MTDHEPVYEVLPAVPPESAMLAELRAIRGQLSIIETHLQRQTAWLEHIAKGYSRRPITGEKQ